MKSALLYIAIYFFGCFSLLSAQPSLSFHHLTLEEGLSELTNHFIYKDSRGFVWISSISGLNCFNGSSVKVYLPSTSDTTSMVGSNIQSGFFEDDAARIWFCTYESINCYDPKTDDFSHYALGDNKNEIYGYHVFHLDALGNLWFLLRGKDVYRFDIHSKKFQHVTTLKINGLRMFVHDNENGNINSIYAFKPNIPGVEMLTMADDLTVRHDTVITADANGRAFIPKRMLNDGDTNIWMICKDELSKFDLKLHTSHFIPVPGITAVEHLNDSTMLISINENGVWEFNKKKFAFVHQYSADIQNDVGLLNNTVEFIYRDNHNGIWLSSNDHGVSFATPGKRKFNHIVPAQPPWMSSDFFPASVFEEDDHIICCTNSGKLLKLNTRGEIIQELNNKDLNGATPGYVFKTFVDSRQNFWMSTFNGLFIRPHHRNYTVQVSTNNTWNGLELRDGRIFFPVSPGGIFQVVMNDNQYFLQQVNSAGLTKEYFMIAQDHKGAIWMSEEIKKIIIVDPGEFTQIDSIDIDGVPLHFSESIDYKTGWLATSTGIYEIDRADNAIRHVYYPDSDAWTNNFTNLLVDNKGRYWLTFRNLITVFDPATKEFIIYNHEDGLPKEQYSRYNATLLSNGEMWFMFPGGFTIFRPDHIQKLEIKAIPQITSLYINDAIPAEKIYCQTNGATNITEIEKLKFSYKQNSLSFMVNSLEYSAPSSTYVLYKMDGVDNDWIKVLSGTLVRYPSLPSGNFKFQVMAANSDGIYNDMLRELEIIITPPFWKTWWFRILFVLSLIALAVYIVYLNLSKTIELQKVRLGLYENLHDDIGSRLTSIVFSAEAVLKNDKTANPKLQHIATVAKSIVGNMRRLVWAIDPENDKMENLIIRIRHDAGQILNETILLHLDIPAELKQIIIPGEVRYQITSIINEALTNTSKYAQAENVWITFSKADKILHLVVRDDGVGFDTTVSSHDKVKGSGYGLTNMEKRVSRVKGKHEIHSAPGKGTTINVKIPV